MRADGAYTVAVGGAQIAPLILLRVIDMPTKADPNTKVSVYLTDAEEAISFFDEAGNAEAYLPCGMGFDAFTVEKTSEVKSLNVRLDNVSREFCTLISQVELAGVMVQILRATRDSLSTPDCAQVVLVGHINSWTVTETEIEAEIIVPVSLEQRVPRRMFWPRCAWEFGGTECGATAPVNGIDVTSTLRAISGGSYLFNPAYLAFNDNTGNYWISDQSGTGISGIAYIGQSNVARVIEKIRLYTYASTANNVSSIKIQYKDTGGAWVDLGTWAIPTTASQWNEFTVPAYTPTTAEHSIRLLANSNLGAGVTWRIPEIEFKVYPVTCNHTKDDCSFFGNSAKFGGFPHLMRSRDPRNPWYKTT